MLDLKKMKLIAVGGQAEIYEFENDKILRVLMKPEDEDNLKVEKAVISALKERGKTVPEVYDFIKVDGRPALVMERIYGECMLDTLKKKPLKLYEILERLAALHLEITDSAEGIGLVSIHKRAAYLIPRADNLDDRAKEFALGLLAELPEGNDICHGDFHPGNIIESEGRYYVIDWFGANCGEKLSDIAHTYLLFKNTPKVPGLSRFQSFATALFSSISAGKYLAECRKKYPFDYGEFSKWMVVRAAERVSYGMSSEKEKLVKFINKCMELNDAGKDAAEWWKMI